MTDYLILVLLIIAFVDSWALLLWRSYKYPGEAIEVFENFHNAGANFANTVMVGFTTGVAAILCPLADIFTDAAEHYQDELDGEKPKNKEWEIPEVTLSPYYIHGVGRVDVPDVRLDEINENLAEFVRQTGFTIDEIRNAKW